MIKKEVFCLSGFLVLLFSAKKLLFFQRCYSFSSVPADCAFKPDPNDPKCCKVFDCPHRDQPYGLIGFKDGFGKSLVPENKYKGKLNLIIFINTQRRIYENISKW